MTSRQRDETSQNPRLWRRPAFWLGLGTVMSLAFAIVGLVLTYLALKEPEPRVVFETISQTDILDLDRPLQDLSIVFRGHDVQGQDLNLRIMTINVANTGEVDINASHYDLEDDWGMEFQLAEVIEARLVDTNSDYLRSKGDPKVVDGNTVVFPKRVFPKYKTYTNIYG